MKSTSYALRAAVLFALILGIAFGLPDITRADTGGQSSSRRSAHAPHL